MAAPRADPYATLGVRREASDAEVRTAYRRLVQLHHPDHNAGSAESARRFEAVQEAYDEIQQERGSAGGAPPPPRSGPPRSAARPNPSPPTSADAEARLAEMEQVIRQAHLARERARRAAREAAAERVERPSDEELGYVTTDDSFSKIFADARSELVELFSDRREHPLAKRLTDLIDELDPRK